MLDHVLGRPSAKSRRLQVLAVLAFWTTYLFRGNRNGPPGTRTLSRLLSKRLTAWQMVVLTMTYLYTARNFSTLVGLASPDPLANMYEANFFRATWVLTALDAGFWTAMKIRSCWLRDFASIVFSGFYLVAAEQADEKVRKVRGNLTVEHLRISWNKGTTPFLRFLQGLLGPRLTRWPPRRVRIARPQGASSSLPPIMAWLYYDGSLDELRASGIQRVILDIPGGGFVAMDPRCNDDRLFSWAVRTGLPVLSLDYRKAPEFPFPYALYECHDAYATLVQTRGRCIGLAGKDAVRVVLTGDSAGGNLAAATTLMLAQEGLETRVGQEEQETQSSLPLPEGLVLAYPSLDMNIGNWMSDEQMALIQDRRMRATNKNVIRRKTNQYSDIAGTPHETDDDDDGEEEGGKESNRFKGLTMTPLAKAKTKAGAEGDVDTDVSEGEEEDKKLELQARSPRPGFSHVNVSHFEGQGLQTRPRMPQTDETNGVQPMTGDPVASTGSRPLETRLATSSTISYFNDRVLTPEMMRAMIILYVGPHHRPDFSRDYLLSPILAPDLLLARFPKTYFLTGERDPLVDDTVIFAGRLRRIRTDVDDRDVAEVVLVPGVSHGFLQFPAIYPPAWKWFARQANWIEDAFRHADERRTGGGQGVRKRGRAGQATGKKRTATKGQESATLTNGSVDANPRRHLTRTESSGDDEGRPLEMMRMTKQKGSSNASGSGSGNGSHPEKTAETGDGASSSRSTSPSSKASKRRRQAKKRSRDHDKQLVKLASSDDLLGRRMQGIVGGLTGVTEE